MNESKGYSVCYNSAMKKEYYSYESFKNDTQALLRELHDTEVDTLIGIARGGLTLAHALAEGLQVRNVQTLSTQLYDDTKKRDCITIIENCLLESTKHAVVVDDIADSGETLLSVMQHLRQKYPKTRFTSATLFYKESSCFEPDIWVRKAECWIEFFWEKDFAL